MKLIYTMLLLAVSLTADELITRDKKLQGRFSAFENGQVTFMEYANDAPTQIPIGAVIRINLDEPAAVSLHATVRTRKPEKATLRSFRKGKFYVIQKGNKQKLTPREVQKLTFSLSIMDFQKSKERWEQQQDDEDREPPRKARQYAREGKITIVHFADQSAASKRQGNLCQRLQKDHPHKIAYVRLNAPLGSPVAKLNRLKSTPQFWFYSPTRKLDRKLVNRFTEQDIEQASRLLKP